MNIEDRFWSKVTKTDECWNWNAASNADGYGRFCVNYKMEYAHRVAYSLAHGPIADRMDIDHTCFNKSCVKPTHLRAATRKQNTEHRQGAQSNSGSGIRGVSWHKASRKWRASIKHSGKAMHLGTYETASEAESVVKAKRLELFTHSDQDRVA
jgi:hypothetical protein